MTIEEAKTFLDNLKVCIEEHPIVADWLVEIADRKGEPQTMYYPQVDGITPSVIVKTEPQIDDFFREPTAEERKAVAEYIESISIPTGVNVFDLIDEPQTEVKVEPTWVGVTYGRFEDEPQTDCSWK